MMRTTHTLPLTLAALSLLPATAWSQDDSQREGLNPEMQLRFEQLRQSDRREATRPLGYIPEIARRDRDAARPDREGWRIGVMVDPVDPLLRTHLRLPNGSGMVVERVVDGSPAAKAGLRQGDLILAAGDRPIGSIDALRDAVARAADSGKPLVLGVMKDGKPQNLRITPPEKRKPQARPEVRDADRHPERPSARQAEGPDRPLIRNAPKMPRQPMATERLAGALREMRAELEKQRDSIKQLEKRVDGLSNALRHEQRQRRLNQPTDDRRHD